MDDRRSVVAALTARIVVGDWQLTDALVPVVMLALFPFFEWIDPRVRPALAPEAARPVDHRLLAGPQAPRASRRPAQRAADLHPVEIAAVGAPADGRRCAAGVPAPGPRAHILVFIAVLGFGYEWCHYLIHSDYKPKTLVYRAIWRNHRQHHFKNEHYWFTVTSSGTADRVLRTYPDPAAVATSPTAKNLHAEQASA